MDKNEEKLLEHFRNPRNVGVIVNPDGFGRGENPINGYITDVYLRIENEVIKDIRYKTFGCVATIAVSSGLSIAVKGKSLAEIFDSDNTFEKLAVLLTNEIGNIPDKNWHCLPTAIQTLLMAISDYYVKKKNEERVQKIRNIIAEIQHKVQERIKEQKEIN